MMYFFFLTAPISSSQRTQMLYLVIGFLLFLFTIVGAIGWLFERYIARLSRQVDADTWKVVQTRIVNSPQQFRKLAMKKNYRHALKDFFFPYLLIALSIGLFFVYQAWIDPSLTYADLFDYTDRGFNTLFPIIDWDNIPRSEFFGLVIPSDFPSLLNTPRFVPEAIISYVLFLLIVIAGVLFVRAVLGLFARTVRIYKEANTTFTKSLSEVAKQL
jgi:hypothetical protein